MELTPEQRRRIYEEEEVRIRVERQARLREERPVLVSTALMARSVIRWFSAPVKPERAIGIIVVTVVAIVWGVSNHRQQAVSPALAPPTTTTPVRTAKPAPSPKRLVSEGHWYLTHGNPALAVASYKQAVQRDPSLRPTIAGQLARARKAVARADAESERQAAAARREAERARRQQTVANMTSFEGTPIGIAVSKVKLTKRVNQDYGYYQYVTGNSRFVWVLVRAFNGSDGTAHVNPNDFTLSSVDGYTVSHDKTTYSLGNYFDAVNLPPGGQTSGWLIFILGRNNEYVLHYHSFHGEVEKQIVMQ